jgi:Ca-activated chloride channel family protein
MQFFSILAVIMLFSGAGTIDAAGQRINRSFPVASGARVEIVNHFGRVEAAVETTSVSADDSSDKASAPGRVSVTADAQTGVSEADVKISSSQTLIQIEVLPKDGKKRIDVVLSVPPRVRLKIETLEGEVRIDGDIASADVRTDTGTIAADVPTENIRYELLWTASRPRYLSDFELKKVKERSAGKFQISGTYNESAEKTKKSSSDIDEASPDLTNGASRDGKESTETAARDEKKNRKKRSASLVSLNFQTARGIVLLNIPPNEVSSDLRERPLTNAARAIIRSGDSLLMEAIRRAAPKYYGDYARTLPPLKLEPRFADRANIEKATVASVKIASVRVSDVNNRALGDLTAEDFEVLEGGAKREIVSVRQSTAPFNLVLLLDVSGSVDNYVNFIRKAARNFVNTVDARDRVAIVTFNDDVNVVSRFTTDKSQLSGSLDTFDAGGATAYYDALAYTLADTLRPLKGERTAIVVLTDGDDNRSFLPFDSMLASIQESGALIYPLYVPSGLIAASQADPDAAVDSLRSRYLQGELTSKAKGEGEQLAKVSGGVYYEISKLSQIQTAYEDIVRQLRTAYEIEYRSELGAIDTGVSPRLRIRTKQPNTYVQIRSVEQRTARK